MGSSRSAQTKSLLPGTGTKASPSKTRSCVHWARTPVALLVSHRAEQAPGVVPLRQVVQYMIRAESGATTVITSASMTPLAHPASANGSFASSAGISAEYAAAGLSAGTVKLGLKKSPGQRLLQVR